MPGYIPPQHVKTTSPGDSGAVRGYASKLRAAAKSLQSISDDADAQVYFYSYSWQGDWKDKFLTMWGEQITASQQLNSSAWTQDRADFVKANPRLGKLYDANTDRSSGAFRTLIDACNQMADSLDQYAHSIDQEIAQEWDIFLDIVIIVASVIVTALSFGALGPEAAMIDIAVVGATIGGFTSMAIDFSNQMVNNIVINHDSFGGAFGNLNMQELQDAFVTGYIVGGVSSVIGIGLPAVFNAAGGVFKAAASNTVLRIGIEAVGFGAGTFVGDLGAQQLVSLNDHLRLTAPDWGSAAKDAVFATAGGVVFGGLMHGLGLGGRAPDTSGAVDPTSQQWGIGVTTLDENGGKVSFFALSDAKGGTDLTLFEGSPTSVAREIGPARLIDGTTLVTNDGSVNIDLAKPGTDMLLQTSRSSSWINVDQTGAARFVAEAGVSDGSIKFNVVPGADRTMPSDLNFDPNTGEMQVPKDWKVLADYNGGKVTVTSPWSDDARFTFSLRDPGSQSWSGADPKMIAGPAGTAVADPPAGGVHPNATGETSPELTVQTVDRPVTVVDGTVVDAQTGPPIDASTGSGGLQTAGGGLRLEPASGEPPLQPVAPPAAGPGAGSGGDASTGGLRVEPASAPKPGDVPTQVDPRFHPGGGQQVSSQDQVVQALRQIEGLQPHVWNQLDPGQRVNVLQEVENTVAAVQGRPPLRVVPDNLAPGVNGQIDLSTLSIKVSAGRIAGGADEESLLGTVLHEGRHAYQAFAFNNPGFHADATEVQAWADNWRNYQSYSHTDPESFRRYWTQPIEADARSFEPMSGQVLDGLGREAPHLPDLSEQPTQPLPVIRDDQPTQPLPVIRDDQPTQPLPVIRDDQPTQPLAGEAQQPASGLPPEQSGAHPGQKPGGDIQPHVPVEPQASSDDPAALANARAALLHVLQQHGLDLTDPRVTAYRSQGRPLLKVDEQGNVTIDEAPGRQRRGVSLHVGFDTARARFWLTDMGRDTVVEFQVRQSFLDRLRAEAEPEATPNRSRLKPWRVDLHTRGQVWHDQYAIPPSWFDDLRASIVPGSGKVWKLSDLLPQGGPLQPESPPGDSGGVQPASGERPPVARALTPDQPGGVEPVAHQDQIVQALQHIDGLRPEAWSALDAAQRADVLQQVENTVAGIQGRPPMRVEEASLPPGTAGRYDPATRAIQVSSDVIAAPDGEQTALETVLHDGRHAYQDFAIANPGFHADADQVAVWDRNWQAGRYEEPSVSNPAQHLRYAAQPLETDARSFEPIARQVLEGIGAPAVEANGALEPAAAVVREQLSGPAVATAKGLLERVLAADGVLRELGVGSDPAARQAAERALQSLGSSIDEASRAIDLFDAAQARLRAEVDLARSRPLEQRPAGLAEAQVLAANTSARDAMQSAVDSARGALDAGQMRLDVRPATPEEIRAQARLEVTDAAADTLRTSQVELREQLLVEERVRLSAAAPEERALIRTQYAEARRLLTQQQELETAGLRILTYITEWDPYLGGVPMVNRSLSIGLVEAGHEVFARVGRELPEGAMDSGVHLIGTPHFDPNVDPREQLLYQGEALPGEVDVVIGHSRFSGLAARLMRDERFPDAKLVHFVHMVTAALGRVQGRPEFGLRNEAIERDLVASSDLSVGVGPALTEEVGRLAAMTGSTPGIHELIPGVPFETPVVPAGDHPRTILLFGRADDSAKGAGAAALMLRDLPPDVRLIVRGAPPETVAQATAELSEIAGRFVEVRPRTIDRAQLLGDMREADVVIMPSRSEGFGLVGIEAAGAGVPILVPSTSGVGRFVADPKLFPAEIGRASLVEQSYEEPVPVERWVDRLRVILDNPEEARRIALDLRRALQEQNRTWRGAAESLVAAIRALESREVPLPPPAEDEPRSGEASR